MIEPMTPPAESPVENPNVEQTPSQKEEGYYRRQFEKTQRELERIRQELKEARVMHDSELQRVHDDYRTVQQEAKRLHLELLKHELCAREGLPQNLGKYVTGEDEDSILASIRQVQDDFPAQVSEERGIGLPTAPGKQPLGVNLESMSPIEKIASGLNHSPHYSLSRLRE